MSVREKDEERYKARAERYGIDKKSLIENENTEKPKQNRKHRLELKLNDEEKRAVDIRAENEGSKPAIIARRALRKELGL